MNFSAWSRLVLCISVCVCFFDLFFFLQNTWVDKLHRNQWHAYSQLGEDGVIGRPSEKKTKIKIDIFQSDLNIFFVTMREREREREIERGLFRDIVVTD